MNDALWLAVPWLIVTTFPPPPCCEIDALSMALYWLMVLTSFFAPSPVLAEIVCVMLAEKSPPPNWFT